MGEWTLKYNGAEKSLADWGLSDLQRSRNNLAPDTVTFIAAGRAFDAAELFPYGATVEVFAPDGSRWFYGRVEPWERSGSGPAENQFGRLVNPFWYLINLPFRQTWKNFGGYEADGITPILVDASSNRVVLNQAIDLATYPTGKLNIGQQMIEAINYAIGKGAPIYLGSVLCATDVPIDELKNIRCSDVLNKMWRWVPDGVFFWDYNTDPLVSPYPTLNFKRASDMAARDVDLNAADMVESINLTEQNDWQRPYVLIQYEQENNGNLSIIEDKFPNPLPTEPEKQFGGVEIIITLNGSISHTQSARVRTELIEPGVLAWWKNRISWLNNPDIDQATISLTDTALVLLANETAPSVAVPYEITDGQIATWMNFESARQRASAKVKFKLVGGTQEFNLLITHDCKATNATTNTYSKTAVSQYADPIPAALAEQFYISLRAMTAKGTFNTVEKELSGTFGMDEVINFITPEQPGWAALRAMVQQIDETAVEGRTSITFGAPEHLSLNDLVDLLKITRNRNITVGVSSRGAGQVGQSIQTTFGQNLPEKNSQTAPQLTTGDDLRATRAQIVEVRDDALRVKFWDVATQSFIKVVGSEFVARRQRYRKSLTHETLLGTLLNYSWSDQNHRTSSDGVNSQLEEIYPPYQVFDEITAIRCVSPGIAPQIRDGLGLEPVYWLDDEHRVWAKI